MPSSHDLAGESDRAAADRRRRGRLPGETQAWILPAMPTLPTHLPGDEEGAWEVRIHNVSRLGVGFVSTAPMSVGDQHRLRIGRGPMKRARLIRIVACRKSDDSSFVVGAEFVDSDEKTYSRAS